MAQFLHAKAAQEMLTSFISQGVEPKELLRERDI
jgi:hypothetical protein